MAAKYGAQGIRCNAVAPGLVLTPALQNHYTTPEQIESSLKIYPMPRLCTPEDAKAVVFLASDEAAYVNGTTLMVDGGATTYLPSAQFGEGARGAQ